MKMQRPTIQDVRRMLQSTGRIEGLSVMWAEAPKWMAFPTGYKAWYGTASVQAPGYRARTMIVQRDADGTMVR